MTAPLRAVLLALTYSLLAVPPSFAQATWSGWTRVAGAPTGQGCGVDVRWRNRDDVERARQFSLAAHFEISNQCPMTSDVTIEYEDWSGQRAMEHQIALANSTSRGPGNWVAGPTIVGATGSLQKQRIDNGRRDAPSGVAAAVVRDNARRGLALWSSKLVSLRNNLITSSARGRDPGSPLGTGATTREYAEALGEVQERIRRLEELLGRIDESPNGLAALNRATEDLEASAGSALRLAPQGRFAYFDLCTGRLLGYTTTEDSVAIIEARMRQAARLRPCGRR